MIRHYWLPNTATDEARMQLLEELVLKHHRKGLVTTGWIETFYGGRGGYRAHITTRRRNPDDISDWPARRGL